MSCMAKPVARDSKHIQNSQIGMEKPVAWDSVIEFDLETPQEYETSVESIPFRERVYIRVRIMMNRHRGDRMEDFDRHPLIWGMFMFSTISAAVFAQERLLGQFAFHQKYRRTTCKK